MKYKVIVFSFICVLIPAVVTVGQGVGISDAGFLTSLPPDAPLLNSPVDEATQIQDTVNVIWHSQIHAATYTVQVSSAAVFSDLLVNETGTDTAFTLTNLAAYTTYYWRVFGTNVAGDGDFSETRQFTTSSSSTGDGKTSTIPTHYALLSAYPNPFNPATTITYHLPKKTKVSLVIYNSMGQLIKELGSYHRQAGEYRITWDGRDNRGTQVQSGLYLCHFKAASRVFTQKILLMR